MATNKVDWMEMDKKYSAVLVLVALLFFSGFVKQVCDYRNVNTGKMYNLFSEDFCICVSSNAEQIDSWVDHDRDFDYSYTYSPVRCFEDVARRRGRVGVKALVSGIDRGDIDRLSAENIDPLVPVAGTE